MIVSILVCKVAVSVFVVVCICAHRDVCEHSPVSVCMYTRPYTHIQIKQDLCVFVP